jgi:hypothetical protein
MMNTMPYLLSSATDDLVRATRKLEQATNESWITNWSQFMLQCSHKVMVKHSFVLENSAESIKRHLDAQHALAGQKSKR